MLTFIAAFGSQEKFSIRYLAIRYPGLFTPIVPWTPINPFGRFSRKSSTWSKNCNNWTMKWINLTIARTVFLSFPHLKLFQMYIVFYLTNYKIRWCTASSSDVYLSIFNTFVLEYLGVIPIMKPKYLSNIWYRFSINQTIWFLKRLKYMIYSFTYRDTAASFGLILMIKQPDFSSFMSGHFSITWWGDQEEDFIGVLNITNLFRL